MKKSLLFVGMIILLAANSITAQAQDDNLVYMAVDPCRLADTRSGRGVIAANTSRKFLVSGNGAALSVQGGNPAGCLHPRASSGLAPVAVSAYIVAVPTLTSTGGLLTAFPSDQGNPSDAIATVNFAAGQVIGNTTTATLCQGSGCPAEGPLAVITHNTEQDVVIDVQGYFYPATGSCSDDMVAVGSLCVDKYEASVYDAPTGGTLQSPAGPPGGVNLIVCNADGTGCGKNEANPIYARSETGALPTGRISWYQAAQACANVGKRLATTAEWQMAALGTPPGDSNGCNIDPSFTTPTTAGTNDATCVSQTGAFDMIGNVWEMTSELAFPPASTTAPGSILSSNTLMARSFGGDFSSSGSVGGTVATFTVGPNDVTQGKVGFRCVR